MKKILIHLQFALVGAVAMIATSCQHEKLADAIKEQSFATVNASLPSRIDITSASTFTLTGASLTVPTTVTFSQPTATAFTLNLSTNTDTVANLVTSGVLAPGTVAFSSGAAAVTPQITVPAGVSSVSFNIIVSRSALEVGFGKTLAAVIKVSAPTKGNQIASGKNALVFTVKTNDIIDPASIHDVSFGVTNKVFIVDAAAANYTLGSLNITVNIPVVLNGDPGDQFTVNAVSVPDSVTKAITSGVLPNNSVLYPDANISVNNPTVTILAGTNTAILSFNTKINTLLAVQPAPATPSNTLPTVAFTLKNASKYQVSPTRITTVYAVLDPNFFRPYYGTPFLIKGTVGAVSDPIYCAYYDFGGEGVAYHDDNNKDGDGSWRNPDYVDVNPDYTPRSVVGWTASGEWLSFSINVETTGNYQINSMIGGNSTGRFYSLFLDGQRLNADPMPVIYTSNYNNQGPNLYNHVLTQGYHIIKMYWDNADYDVRGMIMTRLAN
ncbi:hypothetical protein [Mucilaginibacter sp. dw_454]|uniref:hypothetical protein n=1 Tax=Mucilaginibacter sp. dw_454 TaxID=2720079 RepID=UPI001BD3485E|nr:hypothetical protein [Mucilaginibacter sp. dw_454]